MDARKMKMWDGAQTAFGEVYPDARFETYFDYYHILESKIMRNLVRTLVERNDTGDDVLLLGHSMGGVIAHAMATHFVRSRVRGIVTVFSPHTYLWGQFGKQLEAQPISDATPFITFEGTLDWLVPFGTAWHPQTWKHVRLVTDHQEGLMTDQRLWNTIA